MLLNRQDPLVMQALPAVEKAATKAFGKSSAKNRVPARKVHTFGTDMPTQPGDYGIESVNGMAWLVRASQADETIKRRHEEETPLYVQRLMPVDALRIRGLHNAANALAALGLAAAAGCSLAPMLHGLREYRGEPHRMASVLVVRGVEYFDDSKGTNVGATAAALHGLGPERRLVLILGGVGRLYGGIIGAIIYMVARDHFSGVNPQYWYFWIGMLLIAVVVFLPNGILGGAERLVPKAWRRRA
jgi:UDP-N-acetylmuramoylalanine--D-glutamate ligase